MSEDARLGQLWGLDEPPARDPGFELAVMSRLLRRRFWLDAATLVPVVIGAGVVLWTLAPLLGGFDQLAAADTDTLAGLAVSLGLIAAVVVEVCLPDVV